jgi:tripartite-type tricarboxylate transporter receptor subunit TctC
VGKRFNRKWYPFFRLPRTAAGGFNTLQEEAEMKTKRIGLVVLLGFFCGLNFSMAAEIAYPTRPVEITVAASPGGGTDLGARAIAEKAREYLGQEFTVINKSGGGHRLTMVLVSKAKPDGYTLGAVSDDVIVFAPFTERIHYKPLDYTFLCNYGRLDNGLYVLPDSPFKTLRDVIEFARANPGKLSIGVTEVNSRLHIGLIALCQIENLTVNFIPFFGAAPTMMAVLGGHVMVGSSGASGFARPVKSKQVRLLALLSGERMDEYPEVPTLKELGYPTLVLGGGYVILGQKNLEKSVAAKLQGAFKKAMETPSFIKVATDTGIYEKRVFFGDELKAALTETYNRNEKLVKSLGIKPKEIEESTKK